MEILQSVLGALHFDLPAFIAQVFIFFIFHFSMRAILYDRMLDVRNKRDGQIESRLAQAEQMAANARRLKEEYEASMLKLRNELHATLTADLEAAEKSAASVMATARDEASKIRDEGHAKVDSERERLEKEMDARAEALARAIGKNVLENNLPAAGASRILSKLGS